MRCEMEVTRVISVPALRRLSTKKRLSVEPSRSIAIKRDVHEFVVEAPADRFAVAFREVMIDPVGMFGLIRVKRPLDRLGHEFLVGERFQGCYSLVSVIGSTRIFRWLLALPSMRWLIGKIEDAMLSDYAVIDELVLDGEVRTLKYSY